MIELKKISKSFGKHKALNELDLRIPKGSIYGLLGPNGAGKSTTINILLGFIKPDTGSIWFDDKNVTDTIQNFRATLTYIPEQVYLYPYLSAMEAMQYFCSLAGLSYNKYEYTQFLKKTGLSESHIDKPLGKFSKGMRQKVAIALALAKNSEYLLLDEPASGLDPAASNELSKLLLELASQGKTILMATHDLFRVRETCKHIGILRHGTLVTELESSSITSREIEQVYLNYMKD